ncbi:MAG TPA: G1 family glutamic endopeptidase [Stellaceae bacterium]|nr:G1 family glutamic endopeptidase [Stellaceae bacterium]
MLASHSRISVHRDSNGLPKLGPRNEIETSNWSGYAIANFESGAAYTQAQATWTVTKVFYTAPPPVCHTYKFGFFKYKFCTSSHPQWEYSSSWVGIGGYCEEAACSAVDNTLIQLGTEHDASSSNTTEYYAWVEVLPNAPIIVSPSYPSCNSLSCAYPVQPGDVITASLQCTANCAPGAGNQNWLLQMSNQSQSHAGWNFSANVTYGSTLLSAEWIEEAPSSSAGVLPLANYGTANFDPTANGSVPNFAAGLTDAILMVDPYGETSNPSTADGIDVFNTCWGNNANSIAQCPSPP